MGSTTRPSVLATALLTTLCLPAAAEEPLAPFFNAEQVEAAREYREAFRAVKSATDLQAVYRRMVALEATLLAPLQCDDDSCDWPLLASFRETDPGLPGLEASCFEDCTQPALGVDVRTFLEKAAQTEGQDDDAFFELLDAFYTDPILYGGRMVGGTSYYLNTSNVRGYTLLGDGTHLRLLQRMDRIRKSPTQLFAKEVRELREELFVDLMRWYSECAGYSSQKIDAEIAQILDSIELSDEERQSLLKRREQYADPEEYGIEVGCEVDDACTCDDG